jgi:hypothetical protein
MGPATHHRSSPRTRWRVSPLIVAPVVTAALALGGCGAFAPPATPRAGSRTAGAPSARRASSGAPTSPAARAAAGTVARADRIHEVPTPARPERAPRSWPTPEAAVRAFALAYINWTAVSVGPRLLALARDSVGQARATLQLQAREVAADAQLRRGGIANSGVVESVAPLADGARRYVVVTRERTRAVNDAAYRGLAAEWHVSLATVARAGGRWVLSGWQPEG